MRIAIIAFIVLLPWAAAGQPPQVARAETPPPDILMTVEEEQVIRGTMAVTAIINLLTAVIVSGEAEPETVDHLTAAAGDLDERFENLEERLENVESDVEDIRERMILVGQQLGRMDDRLNLILERLQTRP